MKDSSSNLTSGDKCKQRSSKSQNWERVISTIHDYTRRPQLASALEELLKIPDSDIDIEGIKLTLRSIFYYEIGGAQYIGADFSALVDGNLLFLGGSQSTSASSDYPGKRTNCLFWRLSHALEMTRFREKACPTWAS